MASQAERRLSSKALVVVVVPRAGRRGAGGRAGPASGGGGARDLGSTCVLGWGRRRRGEGEAARGRAGRRRGRASQRGRRARREPRGSEQARGVGRSGGWPRGPPVRVPLGELLHGEGGVLVGKLYRGTGGGGGARGKVLALADRGSSGGERERRGLGSEEAGEEGRGGGLAGGEGGEWMEEPRDAGERHLAEGEASTRVGEAGGLAGLGHLAAGEESTRVGDAGGGLR